MSGDLSLLGKPFAPEDIEWRIQSSGIKNGKPWAMVLAYVTSRAIMNRLDEVCGPENWCNRFETGPGGGVLCGISIRVGTEWVTKWDGAENTNMESVKGGLSGAMKRAGAQWGIGRYLYNLEAGWANFHDGGKHRDFVKVSKSSNEGEYHRWDPPALPAWALPDGTASVPKATPPVDPKKLLLERSKTCADSGYLADAELDMYRAEIQHTKSIDKLREIVVEMEKAVVIAKKLRADQAPDNPDAPSVGEEEGYTPDGTDEAFGEPTSEELF
jgi:hypothetical protein